MACLLSTAGAASAGIITFEGSFTADDQVQLFYYSVQTTGEVTVSTTSFAGGGFSPILTLFDSTGAYLFDEDGYGSNSDAIMSWNSVAGAQYIIALTQYDNYANQPNLTDGFMRDGQGNYTAEPPFNPEVPGGSFLLPGPEQRTGNWAVQFQAADELELEASIPEPSTLVTVAGALIFTAWVGRRQRARRSKQVL
jgi:hypothetical protein